jgi:hypothetical protein
MDEIEIILPVRLFCKDEHHIEKTTDAYTFRAQDVDNSTWSLVDTLANKIGLGAETRFRVFIVTLQNTRRELTEKNDGMETLDDATEIHIFVESFTF